MNAATFSSKLFMKSCKQQEREGRQDRDPDLGGDLILGPPEWQPSVLTTVPCYLYDYLFKVYESNVQKGLVKQVAIGILHLQIAK